jgi:hypothetical protein
MEAGCLCADLHCWRNPACVRSVCKPNGSPNWCYSNVSPPSGAARITHSSTSILLSFLRDQAQRLRATVGNNLSHDSSQQDVRAETNLE